MRQRKKMSRRASGKSFKRGSKVHGRNNATAMRGGYRI